MRLTTRGAFGVLYQAAMIMPHRDGIGRLSVRSGRRSDAAHRKTAATRSESLPMPPFRSPLRSVGGRRRALTMRRIACGAPPTRRIAEAISMGHYHRSLVLDEVFRLPTRRPVSAPKHPLHPLFFQKKSSPGGRPAGLSVARTVWLGAFIPRLPRLLRSPASPG